MRQTKVKGAFLLFSMVIVFLLAGSVPSFAIVLFSEDWEAGIDGAKWKSWGSPAPQVRTGEGRNGSTGFDANGDENYQSGVTSYQTFDLTQRPVIEFWAKGNSSSIYWQNIRVGWSETTSSGYGGSTNQPHMIVNVHLAPETSNKVIKYYVGTEMYSEEWLDSYNDVWMSFKIVINSDATVSFYRDGQFIWRSTTSLSLQDYTNQSLVVDGRSYNAPQIVDDLFVYSGVLNDDFSNGFTDWTLFGSPQSQIVDVQGRTDVFDNNGDGWCNSGVVSDQMIDISNGVVISSDVYLQVDDLGGCWVHNRLGLTNRVVYDSGDCLGDGFKHLALANFYLIGDACGGAPVDKRQHSYINGWKMDNYAFVADSYVNGWHTLKAIIDTQFYVHIYIDNVFVGRSSEPIPLEYRTNPYLYLGARSSGYGGKAYMDWVKVERATGIPVVVEYSGADFTIKDGQGNVLGTGTVSTNSSPYWPNNDYVIRDYRIGNVDDDPELEIVLIATHRTYYPGQVYVVDADGTEISRYWNPGYLYSLELYDIDGDGVLDIVVGGTNNDKVGNINVPVVFALDARNMSGEAPPRQGTVGTGTEIWYTFFNLNENAGIRLLSISGTELVCNTQSDGTGSEYIVSLNDGTLVSQTIRYKMNIQITGSGNAIVTSTPSGIDCPGSSCYAYFDEGAVLTLDATSGANSVFIAWNGDCSTCGDATSCDITMDSDKTCSAIFQSIVTLTTPNGGEVIPSGGVQTITWTSLPEAVTFDIEYSINNGRTWRSIATGVSGTSYVWSVPAVAGNKRKCLVRVTGYDAGGSQIGQDQSDGWFMIEVVRITSPNGGEAYSPGDTVPITWQINATKTPVTKIVLKYHKVGVPGWNLITTIRNGAVSNYNWTIPPTLPTGNYRIKINLFDANKNRRGGDKADGIAIQ